MTAEKKEYLAYRRGFRKQHGNSQGYMSFEEWQRVCDEEEETESREWQQHITGMKHSSRYL